MFSYFVGNVYANPNADAAFLRYLRNPSNGQIPTGLAAAFSDRMPVLRRLCLAAKPSGVLVGYKDFKKDFGVGLVDLPRSLLAFQANAWHVFAFCFGTIDVLSRKAVIEAALNLPRSQWNMFGNRLMWWRDRSTGMSLGLVYCDSTDAPFPDNISVCTCAGSMHGRASSRGQPLTLAATSVTLWQSACAQRTPAASSGKSCATPRPRTGAFTRQ